MRRPVIVGLLALVVLTLAAPAWAQGASQPEAFVPAAVGVPGGGRTGAPFSVADATVAPADTCGTISSRPELQHRQRVTGIENPRTG